MIKMNIDDIFVAKTIEFYENKKPKEFYYLSKMQKGDYYEFFTSQKMYRDPTTSDENMQIMFFNSLYIKEINLLTQYIGVNKKMTSEELIEFITKMNSNKK